MKCGIQIHIGGHGVVACQLPLCLQIFFHPEQCAFGDPRDSQPHRLHLQYGAHGVGLLHVRQSGLRHEGTVVGDHIHQTVIAQDGNAVADSGAAGVQSLRQLILHNAVPREKRLGNDLLSYIFIYFLRCNTLRHRKSPFRANC